MVEALMPDLSRPERLQVMLSEEELSALDDWRFRRRMPSRAAAIRELLRLGLHAEGVTLAGSGLKSGDFGVLDGPSGDGSAGAGLST
jgi:hypothetical protein